MSQTVVQRLDYIETLEHKTTKSWQHHFRHVCGAMLHTYVDTSKRESTVTWHIAVNEERIANFFWKTGNSILYGKFREMLKSNFTLGKNMKLVKLY